MAITTRVSITSGWIDYLRLAKPRAILPHLITAASAMLLAVKGLPPVSLFILTLLGGGLVAAASFTLNCYFDRDLDRRMLRTRSRPLPAGRLRPEQALVFGIVTGVTGLLILVIFVKPAAAILAFIALIYYVFAYTVMLKWRTPWAALIGSGIGALTPLIGWMAVTNRIEPAPFLLGAIIMLWTLPHFWSLAIFRKNDYEQAGIRALPPKGVNAWIILSSILLAIFTLVLGLAAGLSLFYFGLAVFLGTGFLYLAVRLKRLSTLSAAWRFYSFTIFYISFLFLGIIIDRLVF